MYLRKEKNIMLGLHHQSICYNPFYFWIFYGELESKAKV
jgi:hypothetical protein